MGRGAVTEQLFSLAGKKALVTGASRGIGQVIAVAFARAGADVALTARTEAGLAETAGEIRALGRQAVEIPADLIDRDAAEGAVRIALNELGQLDVVVNNAGGSSFMAPFLEMRQSGWDKVLRLNLDTTMWICQAAGAHMTARGTGSVINVALGRGPGRGAVPGPLRRRQGRRRRADQDPRRRMGAQRGAGQRALPGLDGDRPEPVHVGLAGRRRGHDRQRPDGPVGEGGGDGGSRRLPRQRSRQLHDRPGPGHRRRPDGHRLTARYTQTRTPGPCRPGVRVFRNEPRQAPVAVTRSTSPRRRGPCRRRWPRRWGAGPERRRSRPAGRPEPRRRGRSPRWRAGPGRRPRPAPSSASGCRAARREAGGPGRGGWRCCPSGGSARRPHAGRRPGDARPRPWSPTAAGRTAPWPGRRSGRRSSSRSTPADARAGRRRAGSGRPARTPWRRAARRWTRAARPRRPASGWQPGPRRGARPPGARLPPAGSRAESRTPPRPAPAAPRSPRGSAAPATASRRPGAWRW